MSISAEICNHCGKREGYSTELGWMQHRCVCPYCAQSVVFTGRDFVAHQCKKDAMPLTSIAERLTVLRPKDGDILLLTQPPKTGTIDDIQEYSGFQDRLMAGIKSFLKQIGVTKVILISLGHGETLQSLDNDALAKAGLQRIPKPITPPTQ